MASGRQRNSALAAQPSARLSSQVEATVKQRAEAPTASPREVPSRTSDIGGWREPQRYQRSEADAAGLAVWQKVAAHTSNDTMDDTIGLSVKILALG